MSTPPTPVVPTTSRRRRVVAYLGVGAASLVVDVGVLVLAREALGVSVWLAGTLGYWSSVGVNYGLNRKVSFADRRPPRSAVLRYAVLLAVNWGVTVLVLGAAEAAGTSYAVGKVAAVLLLTALNYVAYSRWVFVEPGRR